MNIYVHMEVNLISDLKSTKSPEGHGKFESHATSQPKKSTKIKKGNASPAKSPHHQSRNPHPDAAAAH